MLKVWGRKTSSNVQALMWCIGELGLEYERFDAGHIYGGTDTPEFIAMNPNQTVPVLQDGGNTPLWETGAILRYLANRYARDTFWPKEILAHSEVDKWSEWAKLNIALNFTVPIFWKTVRTTPRDQDHTAIEAAVITFENKLKIAEQQLATTDYLAGDNFTLADIQFGHLLFRYYDIEIERAAFPALAAYYDRLTKRPAYQKHVMVSYDELRVV
ncbi:MAG: glutathione S-transferase family protein [Amylibacter sp.]|nr:glutathione S-transferase family protein [Amylibacter sp.]